MSEATVTPLDAAQVRDALDILLEPGSVAELRILTSTRGVVSGYFDDLAKLAEAAARWDGKAPGVYVTLNPVTPALLARASNRTIEYTKQATGDADVSRRRWFPLDFDPIRPSGISSTDDEHDAALALARKVRDWLAGGGWPDPWFIDSGNGAHLLYPVELPNTPEALALITACLAALAFRFSDERVTLDLKVGNAARIWKLPGTMTCKGDTTADRPHRRSQILERPALVAVRVPIDLLEALATQAPTVGANNGHPGVRADRMDVEDWIREHQLPVVATGEYQGGRKWILNPCPWNAEHTNRSAFILQFPNGATAAGCHHNGCSGNDWRGLRELYEPARGASPCRTNASSPVEPIGGFRLTDVGNSARFAAMHGHMVRHVKQWDRWLCWDGTRWVRDETGEVVRLARETVDSLYREAGGEPDDMRRKALAQHAVRSDSAAKIQAMLSLAESESDVAIRPDDLDRGGWLLNCLNGTLDLKTGALRPHQRDDLITKLSPVAYDPAATCPTFDGFLRQIMGGNDEISSYLQRLTGYCLTGDVSEQGFDLFYGYGANGKSTLLTVILAMLGDYGKQAAPGLLMRKYGDAHPTEVADLHGARCVSVIEVEEGKHLAEVLTKQLTGGDRLKARLMRQDFFEFDLTFKIIMAVNHLPRVTGTDEAIWRRIRTTPFSVTIPKVNQDRHLPEKLKNELPGILAWAVRGCLEWQQRGLEPPREVQAATAQYRSESDLVGGFLDECTRATGEGYVLSKDLYGAYVNWCEAAGERARSQRQFGGALSERGFARQRVRQGHSWLGLELVGASAP